jgi:hypothetical protein
MKAFFFMLLLLLLGVSNYSVLGSPERKPKTKGDSLSYLFKPMGLFDLMAGTDFRTAGRANENLPSSIQTNYAAGFSARMQSSVLWSYRSTQKKRKRFTWGDILAGEVFAGKLSTTLQHESGNVWTAYQFEFGFGGRLTINEQSELGLNLILLKFSRDNVSGNISGSGILGRYRYKRIMLDAGAEARQERAFGVVIDVRDKIPLQGLWSVRYLMPSGRNLGIKAETLSGIYHQDGYQYSKMWSVKIFYGIYF